MKYLQELDRHQLLSEFELMLKTDHYDPHRTPRLVETLRQQGITTDMYRDEVLRRMSFSYLQGE